MARLNLQPTESCLQPPAAPVVAAVQLFLVGERASFARRINTPRTRPRPSDARKVSKDGDGNARKGEECNQRINQFLNSGKRTLLDRAHDHAPVTNGTSPPFPSGPPQRGAMCSRSDPPCMAPMRLAERSVGQRIPILPRVWVAALPARNAGQGCQAGTEERHYYRVRRAGDRICTSTGLFGAAPC